MSFGGLPDSPAILNTQAQTRREVAEAKLYDAERELMVQRKDESIARRLLFEALTTFVVDGILDLKRQEGRNE